VDIKKKDGSKGDANLLEKVLNERTSELMKEKWAKNKCKLQKVNKKLFKFNSLILNIINTDLALLTF
jgi:flagellar motor switch protein FliG